jgi:prepilin-type processing-associated H-X9-DG protein
MLDRKDIMVSDMDKDTPNRFKRTMKDKKALKESIPLPATQRGAERAGEKSPPKAQSGKGKSFEDLLSSLYDKVAKFLSSLLGENSRVVSLGPGGNWVLDSPKYEKLVSVVVLRPDRVKVQYLSSGTANVLFVDGSEVYVRPSPQFEERLEKEYKELRVDQVFDGKTMDPTSPKARVVVALTKLNYKPRGNNIMVGLTERGPIGDFVRKVLFSRETPHANRIFLGHLPNGISAILGYRDQKNLVLFSEVFIEGEGGKVKHRVLESKTKKKFEKIVQAVGAFDEGDGEEE